MPEALNSIVLVENSTEIFLAEAEGGDRQVAVVSEVTVAWTILSPNMQDGEESSEELWKLVP